MAISQDITMGIYAAILFAAYLRPGEGQNLLGQNVLPPQGSMTSPTAVVALNMAPRELQMHSKTLTWDDTILLDCDVMPWLGSAVLALAQRAGPNDTIFKFQPEDVRDVFAQSVAALGLPNDSVLYQFRHSGASYDLLFRKREYEVIKARGRWRTETSMRRYAKQGRVQRLMGTLSPQVTRYCQESVERIGKIVARQLIPQRPPK